MQTDFFSQKIATVATKTTAKMFLKLCTNVTLFFFFLFFPYDHWETSFSTFAKLVNTSLELVFDLTLLVSTTSTKERMAGKLKAINQASFATLMLKPFQRYWYVTVELQRYLTLCGNKIMQMCKPGIQSVINTRHIIWKPRNKDIFLREENNDNNNKTA